MLQSLVHGSGFNDHDAFPDASRDLSGEPQLRRVFSHNSEGLPRHRGLVQTSGQPPTPEQAQILPLPSPASASSISSPGLGPALSSPLTPIPPSVPGQRCWRDACGSMASGSGCGRLPVHRPGCNQGRGRLLPPARLLLVLQLPADTRFLLPLLARAPRLLTTTNLSHFSLSLPGHDMFVCRA